VSALITLKAADFQPAVKRHFDDRQIVELTVLIATYNMNARVLRALELDLEPSVPPQSE
jgi:alkylhydroperoxidase family enzyme